MFNNKVVTTGTERIHCLSIRVTLIFIYFQIILIFSNGYSVLWRFGSLELTNWEVYFYGILRICGTKRRIPIANNSKKN